MRKRLSCKKSSGDRRLACGTPVDSSNHKQFFRTGLTVVFFEAYRLMITPVHFEGILYAT